MQEMTFSYYCSSCWLIWYHQRTTEVQATSAFNYTQEQQRDSCSCQLFSDLQRQLLSTHQGGKGRNSFPGGKDCIITDEHWGSGFIISQIQFPDQKMVSYLEGRQDYCTPGWIYINRICSCLYLSVQEKKNTKSQGRAGTYPAFGLPHPGPISRKTQLTPLR